MNIDNFPINKSTFVLKGLGNISDKYEVVKLLGTGTFGKVAEVRNKISKQIFACKEIAKKRIVDINKLKTEIAIMIKADHPNIIKLYEIYQDNFHIDLIMEECKGGELFERIIRNIEKHKNYSEKTAAKIFKQLISAIAYCHSQGICHRDLKPENILFLSEEEDSPIKVIDFGLSKIFGAYNNIINNEMTSFVGTAYYVSPEVLQGKYNEKCDIWSAGVILYIMLNGEPPFNGSNDNEIYRCISQMKFSFPESKWKNISEDAKDLIKKMICAPERRFNAQQVLNHVWIKKNAPHSKGNIINLNLKHLKKYINTSKIQKAVLIFIASRLHENEVNHLKQTFEEIDLNKDGTLTFDELKTCLSKVIDDDGSFETLFNAFDTDNNGKVAYTEFLAGLIEENIYMKQEKLLDAFKLFDFDNDGKISKKEVISVLKGLNIDDNNLKESIHLFDTNGDNLLDYKEFVEMMNKLKL
jgi:calcium-dependent protein kinase